MRFFRGSSDSDHAPFFYEVLSLDALTDELSKLEPDILMPASADVARFEDIDLANEDHRAAIQALLERLTEYDAEPRLLLLGLIANTYRDVVQRLLNTPFSKINLRAQVKLLYEYAGIIEVLEVEGGAVPAFAASHRDIERSVHTELDRVYSSLVSNWASECQRSERLIELDKRVAAMDIMVFFRITDGGDDAPERLELHNPDGLKEKLAGVHDWVQSEEHSLTQDFLEPPNGYPVIDDIVLDARTSEGRKRAMDQLKQLKELAVSTDTDFTEDERKAILVLIANTYHFYFRKIVFSNFDASDSQIEHQHDCHDAYVEVANQLNSLLGDAVEMDSGGGIDDVQSVSGLAVSQERHLTAKDMIGRQLPPRPRAVADGQLQESFAGAMELGKKEAALGAALQQVCFNYTRQSWVLNRKRAHFLDQITRTIMEMSGLTEGEKTYFILVAMSAERPDLRLWFGENRLSRGMDSLQAQDNYEARIEPIRAAVTDSNPEITRCRVQMVVALFKREQQRNFWSSPSKLSKEIAAELEQFASGSIQVLDLNRLRSYMVNSEDNDTQTLFRFVEAIFGKGFFAKHVFAMEQVGVGAAGLGMAYTS